MELVYDYLKNHIREVSVRNKKSEIIEVLSVTNKDGFVKSKDFFSKEVYSKNLSNYKVVKRNQIAYNPSRINVGSIDVLNNFEQGIISPLYVVFECKDELNPNFLKYYLKSDIGKKMISNNTSGSVRDTLKYSSLGNIKIKILPKELQEKSVIILDKAQDLIGKRKAQIEDLDELVKSRFIEMFGDPSKNEKAWEVTEMGTYLNILTDYHSNGSYETLRDNVTLLDTPNYALMVRTTDLENNNFENEVKYIDEHAYNHLEKSKVFGGEIIINKIGSAGKVYLMPCLDRPVSLAMNQFLLRFDEEKVNHTFLYNLLLTPYMESKIKEKVRGAVTKTITKDAVREINIIVPPITLQNEFVEFVKQVDKLKFEMEQSLKELEDNFNSLMQRAFNGELFKN